MIKNALEMNAMAVALDKATTPTDRLSVGDKVKIVRGDFINNEGEVAGFKKNMIGTDLVKVKIEGFNNPLSFYRYEVKKIPSYSVLQPIVV